MKPPSRPPPSPTLPLGPSGDYPNGKLNEDDEGGLFLQVGMDEQNQIVLMDFGAPTAWIGMTPEDALRVAEMLHDRAVQLLRERSRAKGRTMPLGDRCESCGHDHFRFKSVSPGNPRWVCASCDTPLP